MKAAGDKIQEASSQCIDCQWLPDSQKIVNDLEKRHKVGELEFLANTYLLRKYFKTIGVNGFPDCAELDIETQSRTHEMTLFYDEAIKKAIGVCQFGPNAQGPEGFVHGGAIASMVDIFTSFFMSRVLLLECRTANLHINYRRSIPLNCAVLLEVWRETEEGRKHWVNYKMMSADGKTIYSDGSALWIELKSKL